MRLRSLNAEFRQQIMRHGEGVQTFSDKSEYTGQWAEDKMDGHGQLAFSNGSEYKGSFVNGTFEGS